jgi:limonene-1,2-epoxide hydrolase
MLRVSRWTCLLGLALLASACGSDAKQAKTPPPPKRATPAPLKEKPAARADVAVIKGWTDALRHGHVKAASRYWGLPAVVSNGSPVYRLTKRSQVEIWNRSLPCGATFKEAVDTGAYVVATLVLTERPGVGKCGAGAVGNEAYTAFLIRRHKIVQWRRVTKPAPEATPAGPQS